MINPPRRLRRQRKRRLCHGISPVPPLAGWFIFLVIIPLSAHLIYSWMGFNPTDDGFVLAYSRRILEGQIPHRDFITIRPAGSAFLHLAFVALGGDHTFWLSRLFVWFEFAFMAWAWTWVLPRIVGLKIGALERWTWALIAFVLSVHFFPIMAWHTIDAMFLSSLGLLLASFRPERTKLVGYAVIGASALCKQNFLFMIPTALLVLGDWRRLRYWLAAAVPALLYMAELLAAGGMGDALIQMTSQTDLVTFGIFRYIYDESLRWGFLQGFLGTLLALRQFRFGFLERFTQLQVGLGLVALALPVLGATVALPEPAYLEGPVFSLFGAALGATASVLILALLYPHRRAYDKYARGGLVVLGLAWSASISVGYNTPALGAGMLGILLLTLGFGPYSHAAPHDWTGKIPVSFAFGILVLALFQFNMARQTLIYRDRASSKLTASLDGVLPGLSGIRTNTNTRAFLVDLDVAVSKTAGIRYAILPDLAAYWVTAPTPNPLPIDWAQNIELDSPALVNRVIGDMERQRGREVFIVQKERADSLAAGFLAFVGNSYSPPMNYLRTHFTKFDETMFFELYK
jgi:hypothetical protein